MHVTGCDTRSKVYSGIYIYADRVDLMVPVEYTWTGTAMCIWDPVWLPTEVPQHWFVHGSSKALHRGVEKDRPIDRWLLADETCPITAGCSGRFRICMLCESGESGESGDGANESNDGNDVKCNFWKVTPILFKDVQGMCRVEFEIRTQQPIPNFIPNPLTATS